MIETVKCAECGSVVMKDFLHDHMRYVHGSKQQKNDNSIALEKGKRKAVNRPPRRKKRNSVLVAQLEVGYREHYKPSKAKAAPYADAEGMAICVLCKKNFPAGQLEDHLRSMHGASDVLPAKDVGVVSNQWVFVLQGGLPSLGKRSR